MSLSVLNKICLLALHGLSVNLLFAQPSLVDGYTTTPCTECFAPIVTRNGEAIPERCNRLGCLKFDSFPLTCLAVLIGRGSLKTVRHKSVLSLVVYETPNLSHILPANALAGFWIPTRAADQMVFINDSGQRNRQQETLHPPVWTGDERPFGARRVRLRSRFPSCIFASRLINELGYPPEAAEAFFARAHSPWINPPPDRRKNTCSNLGDLDASGRQLDSVALPQPSHPYNPASPSRRTHVGGGFSEKRVYEGLRRMRTDDVMQKALFEIVSRRRSTLQVADEFGVAAENLYVYASRLRKHIRTESKADLHVDSARA